MRGAATVARPGRRRRAPVAPRRRHLSPAGCGPSGSPSPPVCGASRSTRAPPRCSAPPARWPGWSRCWETTCWPPSSACPVRSRRWKQGSEQPGPESRRRISDLDHVLDRLLMELYPDQVGVWLTSPNPHLGSARPVDVLELRGAATVLPAVDALAQGTFV